MVKTKQNCLIIGGGGFIGSWLAKNLTDKGHKVIVVDHDKNYFNTDSNLYKKVKSFRERSLLKKVVIYHESFQEFEEKMDSKKRFDVIFHLGAHAVEKQFDNKISSNQITEDIALTYKIISFIKKTSESTKLIFMSSSAVYGDYEYSVSEYASLNPTSAYGVSKAASEFLIKGNLQNWNIVRANIVYGFSDIGERATHLIASKAFNREKAWVNDLVWCDFIYVKDLVEGISNVLEKAQPKEIFHLSGGESHKLLEYAMELKKYFKFGFETKSVNDRPMRGVLNNSKAKMLLGWYPKYTLKDGIRDYVKYIKKYKIA